MKLWISDFPFRCCTMVVCGTIDSAILIRGFCNDEWYVVQWDQSLKLVQWWTMTLLEDIGEQGGGWHKVVWRINTHY